MALPKIGHAIAAYLLGIGALTPPADAQIPQVRPHSGAALPMIVGGSYAQTWLDFPWQVSIGAVVRDVPAAQFVYRSQCGGSIIAPNVVLTAAHCVIVDGKVLPNDSMIVYSGNPRLPAPGNAAPINGGHYSFISNILVHPEYRANTPPAGVNINDVALIFISSGTGSGNTALPGPNNRIVPLDNGSAIANISVKLAGWGQTMSASSDTHSSQLKYASLVVLPSCSVSSHGGHFCVGRTNPPQGSSCQGDSGGPLTRDYRSANSTSATPATAVQVGLVSSGPRDCTEPAVYTRVSHYNDWIKAAIVAQGPLLFRSTDEGDPRSQWLVEESLIPLNFNSGIRDVNAAGRSNPGLPPKDWDYCFRAFTSERDKVFCISPETKHASIQEIIYARKLVTRADPRAANAYIDCIRVISRFGVGVFCKAVSSSDFNAGYFLDGRYFLVLTAQAEPIVFPVIRNQ